MQAVRRRRRRSAATPGSNDSRHRIEGHRLPTIVATASGLLNTNDAAENAAIIQAFCAQLILCQMDYFGVGAALNSLSRGALSARSSTSP